jgi:hypothetical protein
VVDRETFERIKQKHGRYASWAVWAEASGNPKSNVGDLSVLDPDRNPTLLQTLRTDVIMVGLNVSRFLPVTLGNFHDSSPAGQDFKIRYAFAETPYYGAYMTDVIKGVVTLESGDLIRYIGANPSVVAENVSGLLEEFTDLNSTSPLLIAFGGDAYQLAAKHVPANRYSQLVKVTHYSHFISKEAYRDRVLAALAP